MKRSNYDAVVIGAGHNGLVTATYLARAGYQVLVLERNEFVGGAAATREVFPGWRANTGAVDAGLFLPEIVSDLHLENYGLQFIESPVLAYSACADGRGLTLWRDPVKARDEIAQFSKADAERYPAFLQQVSRMAAILRSILTLTPPAIPDYYRHPRARRWTGELLPWLRVALQVKRLGDGEMMEFLRILPMPVKDYLDEWFESPQLNAALGMPAMAGSMQGPRASGTAFMFLYQAVNAGQAGWRASRFVRGGAGQISQALAEAAQKYGAEICTGLGVEKVILEGERAAAVRLDDGQQIKAGAIVSSANPRHTFFELVGASHLPVRFVREVKNIKFRGSTARINLALSALPGFSQPAMHSAGPGKNVPLSGHVLICPDLEALERAYDDAKYGRISERPCLDLVIPSLLDDSLAPAGQHLMSIDVRYAPYHLREGSWEEQDEVLYERVMGVLEAHAPGIGELVLQRQVLTPLDLERRYGLPEGGIYHGQMGLDQLLFMRPIAGYGQYSTPLENLFLCGAGTHPGGGLSGAPGYNAARKILKHLK
ncbi:MAG: NAD(P)/FAD-dependent oxidoreductase [Anaerolineales bacterium]